MWHVVQIGFHTALAIVGAFCLLTAGLAYPGEEGQMQSTLEDLWAKIDDRQRDMLSAHTAFMQQVAKAASRGFDRLFGHRLFSLQCLGVSISYSIASYGLVALLLNIPDAVGNGSSYRTLGQVFGSDLAISVYLTAGYLFIGSIPTLFKNFRFIKTWLFLILGSFPLLWLHTSSDSIASFKQSLSDFVLWGIPTLVGCFGCDVLFLAVTRRSLRWAGEMTKTYKIAALILLNLVFAFGLMLAPFFEAFGYILAGIPFIGSPIETTKDRMADLVLLVSGSNAIDVLAACAFIVLAALLLIHRALWPLLNRSVFRLQEIGTRGRRAVLISLGLALLGVSTGANVAEWARRASELLKG